jgi:hypothetical protein
MSVSSEVQRTLVKSPPELWAELSDPASLANHLGELGEIRIVRTVPETTVEWEAAEVTGTVQIKPSAWGTRVTLSVTRERAQLDPEPQLVGAGVGAPTVQPDAQPQAQPHGSELAASAFAESKFVSEAASGSARPADVESAPGVESESPAPADVESAPEAESKSTGPADAESAQAPQSENPGKLGAGRTPAAAPADRAPPAPGATGHGDAQSAASEPEHHPEGVATAGEPRESQPRLAARRRFLKRAWRRLRRLRPVAPTPSPVVESAEDPLPEPSAAAAGEPSPMLPASEPGEERLTPQPAPVAGGQPSRADSPSEPGEERVAQGPSAVTAGEAASATGLAPARSDGPNDPELERRAAQTANAPPDPGELERRTVEEMTAVLMSMLDRLGAAHHRPFSRG